MEQTEAEMKSEEKSGNSMEQNVAERNCEEGDYSLRDETEWVDTYESNGADVENTYRTMNATEIYCDDSRDPEDIKNILKQP